MKLIRTDQIQNLSGYILTHITDNVTPTKLRTGSYAYIGGDITLTPGTNIQITQNNQTLTITNSYALPEATKTILGGVYLASDDVGAAVPSISTTANRTYGVQRNADKQLVVNVPWTDTNTNTFRQINIHPSGAASASSILASSTTTALTLKAGTNMQVSNSGGVVTFSASFNGNGYTLQAVTGGNVNSVRSLTFTSSTAEIKPSTHSEGVWFELRDKTQIQLSNVNTSTDVAALMTFIPSDKYDINEHAAFRLAFDGGRFYYTDVGDDYGTWTDKWREISTTDYVNIMYDSAVTRTSGSLVSNNFQLYTLDPNNILLKRNILKLDDATKLVTLGDDIAVTTLIKGYTLNMVDNSGYGLKSDDGIGFGLYYGADYYLYRGGTMVQLGVKNTDTFLYGRFVSGTANTGLFLGLINNTTKTNYLRLNANGSTPTFGPITNNAVTLGTSDLRFANAYFSALNIYGTTLTQNVTPRTTNTSYCGTDSLRWLGVYSKDLNLSGSATISGNTDISGTLTTSTLRVNTTATIGGLNTGPIEITSGVPYIDFHHANSTSDYTARIVTFDGGGIEIEATGTSNEIRLHGHTNPRYDNNRDLGIAGRRWKNVYAMTYNEMAYNYRNVTESNLNSLLPHLFTTANTSGISIFRSETFLRDRMIQQYGPALAFKAGDTHAFFSVNPFGAEATLTSGSNNAVLNWTRRLAFTVNDTSVSATAFYETSLRKYKENIKPFELSGLELVNSLEIVRYDRKDTENENGIKNKIGIIADDTNDEFLSEEQNAVDIYKTIFIQAKAIQELSDKNTELENRLSQLEEIIKKLGVG